MISKRERNSITAKMDMLNAVRTTLIKHGFAKLGINLVSEEASMDKSAIYRHFGDFKGLLAAYIEKQDYWLQSIQQFNPNEKITKELVKKLIREQYDTLYNSQELQELIRWEIAEKGNTSSQITVKREIYSKDILEKSRNLLSHSNVNFNFILALVFGGIYYVILHKEKGPFCEVDLTRKAQKEELMETIDWLIDRLFETHETQEILKKRVVSARQEGNGVDSIARIFDISVDEVKALLK